MSASSQLSSSKFPGADDLHPPSGMSSRSPLSLPDIPTPDLDLTFALGSISGTPDTRVEKVQKRASNVLKLTQENEKLKEELRAMTARLEAAERKRQELDDKRQKQQPSQRPAQHSS
ncbi:hypothetical protein ID866_5132 [Astraeus odoratus]|nr:hypothetical protein ID866_5132 [Astraeus odoratus]